ncbi:DedA family protein [Bacteroidetes/Chlorobi group bacterium ChocPot_Mid]|nr:MAG: DedA family protein [Bacteroidetes/Chlorobi group bacterium ChocPot_Mid]
MLEYLNEIVAFLQTVPWYLVLVTAFFITILENIFPPSPSDSVIIFTGTLVGIGTVGLFPLLIVTTAGSILGFAVMFYLGRYLGHRIIKSKRIPFINEENIKKPNKWITKYGYVIIALNRFLSGTRGVVSLLAGMAELNPTYTISLAGVSALIWNFILIYLGVVLGENWRRAEKYLEAYERFILPAVILILLLVIIKFVVSYVLKKRKEKSAT